MCVYLFSELRKGGMAIQIDGNFEIVVWRCGRSWWITGLLEQATSLWVTVMATNESGK